VGGIGRWERENWPFSVFRLITRVLAVEWSRCVGLDGFPLSLSSPFFGAGFLRVRLCAAFYASMLWTVVVLIIPQIEHR
jgi:hypothetical protein